MYRGNAVSIFTRSHNKPKYPHRDDLGGITFVATFPLFFEWKGVVSVSYCILLLAQTADGEARHNGLLRHPNILIHQG
jgi:hypothetical protein